MPIDRGAIDAQLREIGEGERWWEVREFRDLPHVLQPDERILGLVRGKLLAARRPRVTPSRRWLIVATTQRLLCLRQERYTRKQLEIVPGQIISLSHGSRLRAYQIVLQTERGRYRIRIPKAEAFRFVGALGPFVPQQPGPRLHPELEPFAWIPGLERVASIPAVAGIVSKVSMLSPPDYASLKQVERLEATVEKLQNEIEQLRQNVDFLEELLERDRGEIALPRPSSDV